VVRDWPVEMIEIVYWVRPSLGNGSRTGRVYLPKIVQEDIGGVASVIPGNLIGVIIAGTARDVL